jgi:hypothetical protein
MGFADKIQAHLDGDSEEKKRRGEILCDLLKAFFEEGGEDAAGAALKRRMEEIDRRFEKALERLNEKL